MSTSRVMTSAAAACRHMGPFLGERALTSPAHLDPRPAWGGRWPCRCSRSRRRSCGFRAPSSTSPPPSSAGTCYRYGPPKNTTFCTLQRTTAAATEVCLDAVVSTSVWLAWQYGRVPFSTTFDPPPIIEGAAYQVRRHHLPLSHLASAVAK